jgi:hypothetical protein
LDLCAVVGGCCSGSNGSAVAACGVLVVKDHQQLARLRLLVQEAGRDRTRGWLSQGPALL